MPSLLQVRAQLVSHASGLVSKYVGLDCVVVIGGVRRFRRKEVAVDFVRQRGVARESSVLL
jgi:aryl carrier-like protein